MATAVAAPHLPGGRSQRQGPPEASSSASTCWTCRTTLSFYLLNTKQSQAGTNICSQCLRVTITATRTVIMCSTPHTGCTRRDTAMHYSDGLWHAFASTDSSTLSSQLAQAPTHLPSRTACMLLYVRFRITTSSAPGGVISLKLA